MRFGDCLLAVLATILLADCGGTASDPVNKAVDHAPVDNPIDPGPPAPAAGDPYLHYDRPLVLIVGVPGGLAPDNLSADTTITVSPALPAGLTLNADTGTISGTPTSLSAGQLYTLSAVNAQGSASAQLIVEVNDGPLFYPSPAIVSVGTAMPPLAPTGTKFLSGYSVSPALPNGLSLDKTTGVISGTPTAASPAAYYTIIGADVGFKREYGLTLGVADPSAGAAQVSAAPFDCAYSGGFLGTFARDSTDSSYGLIAIAFTPDGNAHARVGDLSTSVANDSDGLEGLSKAMDGSFKINFPAPSNLSLSGRFLGPDLLLGTYQNGPVSKPFTAARLGGSPSATYRYTGGFGSNNGYRIDFGTVDVTGSALTGVGYQMGDSGKDYLLINRQLPFAAAINNGMFEVTIDSSTTNWKYVTGQSHLALGDPYDALFFTDTYGCQLN